MIKSGGAALVTEPGDVLALLESPARHSFTGTHADRYADPSRPPDALFEEPMAPASAAAKPRVTNLTPEQQRIIEALESPLTTDDLARATGMPPSDLRVHLTRLEIQRRVQRQGSKIARV